MSTNSLFQGDIFVAIHCGPPNGCPASWELVLWARGNLVLVGDVLAVVVGVDVLVWGGAVFLLLLVLLLLLLLTGRRVGRVVLVESPRVAATAGAVVGAVVVLLEEERRLDNF